MHIYILPQCSTTAARVLNSAGMDAQFERLRCAISRGILTIAQPFFMHRFHNHLFEHWRISFVWYSFWHNKSPHLLDSISYCLTDGVQFIAMVAFFFSRKLLMVILHTHIHPQRFSYRLKQCKPNALWI